MSNPERICLPYLTYHVFSRCHDLKNMMTQNRMKDLLIEVLIITQEKYEFELIAYTIMDNHFHFIIRTVEGGESISRIMQFIKARYAQKYNSKVGRKGAFWNERFGDTVIEHSFNPIFYLIWLLWYLGFNPVKKRLIKNPRDYKYSSINVYLNENYISPVRITYHKYFLTLGSTFSECVEKFLDYEKIYKRFLAFNPF